jgi:two-component system response regulator HydG
MVPSKRPWKLHQRRNGYSGGKKRSQHCSPVNGSPAPDTLKERAPVILHSGEYIFGDTATFKQLLQQIDLVGPTNYTVIIYGESGSGKEAIAQEIHKRSKRKNRPLWPSIAGRFPRSWPAPNFRP